MLKLFNTFAQTLFTEQMMTSLPLYKRKKSLRGPLAGAANFEFKVDSDRIGWICFGGFKDGDFAALAGWTVSGKDLRDLSEWEQYGNPRAFQVPPIPTDGYVDLRDRWRFEDSSTDAWHDLSLGPPPEDFAQKVFETYVITPEFEEYVQSSLRGAQRLYTKNMPPFEQIRAECLVAEKSYCESVWSHLAERHKFSDDELQMFFGPIASKAVDLALRYGHPLIRQQLRVNGA
jgi:hypothetical protein